MTTFPILTLPVVKQRQIVVKKPVMTYEFISRKDIHRYAEFARQAWLLGLHEDGFLRDHLRSIWDWGDRWQENCYIGKYDFVVARANGAIVGIILHEAAVSTIDTYVIPSWRRRGIASGIVGALREFVGDRKVLCGWTGKEGQGWESYYARNFILHMDQAIPKTLVAEHGGDKKAAEKAFFKSLKLKMAAAYRKHKSGK